MREAPLRQRLREASIVHIVEVLYALNYAFTAYRSSAKLGLDGKCRPSLSLAIVLLLALHLVVVHHDERAAQATTEKPSRAARMELCARLRPTAPRTILVAQHVKRLS